jgi:hypothetical protein
MNLKKAIKNKNRSIEKKSPISINPNWTKYRCKASHKFIVDNIKDEFNQTDWDLVISNF